ncbi:MAG: hypothetical protein AAF614_11960 [Chloroflexota bacterium]
MINWASVIFNSFWIVGLAILLAAFSYHNWQATADNQPLGTLLKQRPFQLSFWLSCILIGIGLIGTSNPWWELIVWSLFTLFSIMNLAQTLRAKPAQREVGDL